ncbi:MAG: Crp/Fnr family transcriptional regulator [Aureispira sp.]|nr:Crp/Fnr family transcriptional regulator [Aureispira sp.]
MSLEKSITEFKTQYPFLTEEDISSFLDICKLQALQSGQQFMDLHEKSWKMAFMLDGLLRGYYINPDGIDMTIMFRTELEVVASWETILLNKPSNHIIEAIDPSQLLVFSHKDLKNLMDQNPKIEKVYNAMLHQLLADSLEHIQSYINEKPENRYKKLLESDRPIHRIPQKYIASFLGITPESFSRLKKRMLD